MEETRGSTSHRPPVSRTLVVRVVGLGVVASAIGIGLGFLIPWFPPAAAKQAHTIDTLYYVLIIVTVPIFVLVTTVVLFSACQWRMRPGEERLDGPPIHGNTQLEVIWTALPAALIAALVVYAAIVLPQHRRQAAQRDYDRRDRPAMGVALQLPGLPRCAGEADRRAAAVPAGQPAGELQDPFR